MSLSSSSSDNDDDAVIWNHGLNQTANPARSRLPPRSISFEAFQQKQQVQELRAQEQQRLRRQRLQQEIQQQILRLQILRQHQHEDLICVVIVLKCSTNASLPLTTDPFKSPLCLVTRASHRLLLSSSEPVKPNCIADSTNIKFSFGFQLLLAPAALPFVPAAAAVVVLYGTAMIASTTTSIYLIGVNYLLNVNIHILHII